MNRAERRFRDRLAAKERNNEEEKRKTQGRLLICTPAYGGLVYVNYAKSLVNTTLTLGQQGIEVGSYLLQNESLIPRGRNVCAHFALESKADKLLFVDSDITWQPEDVLRLWHSDKMIVGGAYPMKTYPIMLNFNPLPHHDHVFPEGQKNVTCFREFRQYANSFGEVEVLHLATGFLMIDCRVFSYLKDKVRHYDTGGLIAMRREVHYDFFRTGAHPSGIYESEDWGFCALAREHGFSTWLNTEITLPHTGTHTFAAPKL